MLAISLELIGSSTNPNVPCSRISRAARRNAASATRDNAPPTLTRLTPIVEVGAAMEEILRARREREWKCEAACRLHRRVDSLDRMFECIDRIVVAIGAVFDGAAGEPGGGRHPDGVGDGLRIISKSVLEVGAHRKIGGPRQRGGMGHHLIARHAVVPSADGECVADAGGRQRLEAHARQEARRADIPWVRNDEGSIALVKRAKRDGLVGLCFRLLV